MSTKVSPLAQVDHRAELGDDVEIGPFCLVGPHVTIGDGTKLDSHVVIVGHTTIGKRNRFWPNSVIGGEPQDISYRDAPTRLEIGDENMFREGVTINRGAEKEDRVTRIGNRNMFMANSHVAHNCHVFDNAVLVNGVLLGGHVHVHDGAIISGNTGVHHFSTVGTLAFVGGAGRVVFDIPPYMLATGSENPKITTINLVGMRRRRIPEETIRIIKRAHRLLFREHKRLDAVRGIFEDELSGGFPAELSTLLDFIERQQQGKMGRAREAIRNRPAAEIENTAESHRRAA